MSTVDDRLRALDPFANAHYAHPDPTAMVERITEPVTHPSHRGRRLVVAPFAATAAVVLGVVALLATAGAPATPLAALSVRSSAGQLAAKGTSASSTAGTPFSPQLSGLDASPTLFRVFADGYGEENMFGETTVLQAAEAGSVLSASLLTSLTHRYELGAAFSTSAPQQDAYEALGPSDPVGLLTRASAALDVRGRVVTVRPAQSWSVGNAWDLKHASLLSLDRDTGGSAISSGLYVLSYVTGDVDPFANGCTPTSTANTGVVDRNARAMAASSRSLLALLGLHYELGAATYSTSWPDPAFRGCASTEVQTQQILVHGVATSVWVRTYFDASGRLVDASTPVFTLGPGAPYPLVSPAALASGLVHRSNPLNERSGSSGHGSAGREPSLSQPPSGRHEVTVRLTRSSVALSALETTDGSTWLLPVYALTGEGYSDEFTSSPTAWSGIALATQHSYVALVGSKSIPLFEQSP